MPSLASGVFSPRVTSSSSAHPPTPSSGARSKTLALPEIDLTPLSLPPRSFLALSRQDDRLDRSISQPGGHTVGFPGCLRRPTSDRLCPNVSPPRSVVKNEPTRYTRSATEVGVKKRTSHGDLSLLGGVLARENRKFIFSQTNYSAK